MILTENDYKETVETSAILEKISGVLGVNKEKIPERIKFIQDDIEKNKQLIAKLKQEIEENEKGTQEREKRNSHKEQGFQG